VSLLSSILFDALQFTLNRSKPWKICEEIWVAIPLPSMFFWKESFFSDMPPSHCHSPPKVQLLGFTDYKLLHKNYTCNLKSVIPHNFPDISYEAHIKSHTGAPHMRITAPDGTPANRCAKQHKHDENRASIIAGYQEYCCC
jgi:hypothetical protein